MERSAKSAPLVIWLSTVKSAVGRSGPENSRIVAHRVGLRIAELQARLPRGIEVQVVYDRSNLVDRTVATVKRNLSEGAVLVVVVRRRAAAAPAVPPPNDSQEW